jgi:TolA-binding protein
VRDEYQGTPVLMPALFGLAQANAALGDDDAAMENFQKVLDEMSKGAGASRAGGRDARRELTPEMVRAELMTLHTDRFEREPARALQYAQLAERAWTLAQGMESGGGAGAEPTQRPADVLLAMAQAHLRMAQEAEAVVGDGSGESADGGQGTGASVSASQLKRHLLDAGAYFREHARGVVVNDNAAYMQSLWNAAEAFDKAGDRPSAKEAFQSYIDGAADEDPRKSEARFRLAQNFQADRDYVTAASLYRQLRAAVIRDDAAGPSGRQGTPGATLWADRAVVPLSRCLLLDSDQGNDEQAEGLLKEMVDGTLLAPESVEFRDALVELGELYHRQGRYPEAISRLGEVLERYPSVPRRTTLMYKLADSNRLEAAAIRQTLLSAMPQSERQALVQMRAQRLSDGAALLERVLEELEGSGRAGPSELESVQQRNAMFFKGDIAMEQEDYARAIAAYDTAAQRYANQPASLVALTQIVSAYAAQRKWNEAATANERAKRQLAAMPEEAFNDPMLPMERRHWERWFEASMAIEDQRRLEGGNATAGAGGEQ